MLSADRSDGADGADGAAALRYHQLHRLGRPGWLRPLLGVLGMVTALLIVVPVLLAGVYAAAGEPFGEVDTDPLTPIGLLVVCLSLAAAVPIVVVVTRVAHDLPAGWVVSVVGRVRWRWLLLCAGLAVVALAAALLVATALPDNGGAVVEGSAQDFTRRSLAYALIVVLLVPLQATGEEYAFRGYLTQAVGGVFPGRLGTALALVVPALLFALAHGAQDAPVFIDRLAFGLVAGALVILTGGLEAGIAMHVLNNVAVFGLTLLFGDMSTALAPVAGTWWLLPGTLVQSLGYLALVVWAARRTAVETSVGQGVLERKRPRV